MQGHNNLITTHKLNPINLAPGESILSSQPHPSSGTPMATVGLSPGVAVAACATMALLYVGILYVPPLLLRLPPTHSVTGHYIRRFVCSAIASVLASVACLLLLPVHQSSEPTSMLAVFGLQTDHLWQATLYPLLLTALLYLGPLAMAALESLSDYASCETEPAAEFRRCSFSKLVDDLSSLASDIYAWRNFVVAPLTEEWVFRACMIPLLLCAGYSQVKVMFLCPLFFGLAHLHHYWEMVYHEKQDQGRAALIVALQFGYTTVFGWYAAFLYLRTGHLVAPLVAHVFCNVMGLPAVGNAFTSSYGKGLGGFIFLLMPATSPSLYSDVISHTFCSCWVGYCKWR